MKYILLIFTLVNFTAITSDASNSAAYNFFYAETSSRQDPISTALQRAQISPNARIQIQWKKISLQKFQGRFFNVNLVFCSNSRPESCQAISQLNPIDKFNIPDRTDPKSVSAKILGGVMHRNDVSNLRLGLRFVNEDGLSRQTIEFESFTLLDLVNNNVLIRFSDSSEVEIQLLNSNSI